MPEKQQPRILFADNDLDILELLSLAARQRGWVADCATTGEELIEAVNHACVGGGPCYDIIVTDIRFGRTEVGDIRITGVAAAREVRDKFQNLPILFLTGWSGPLTRESVAAISNAEIIDKPFDVDSLMYKIERLMNWSAPYDGIERRTTSINRSGMERRCTDRRVTIPQVLIRAMNASRRVD